MTEKAPRKLLCVTAHPDDECFGFGGAGLLHRLGDQIDRIDGTRDPPEHRICQSDLAFHTIHECLRTWWKLAVGSEAEQQFGLGTGFGGGDSRSRLAANRCFDGDPSIAFNRSPLARLPT